MTMRWRLPAILNLWHITMNLGFCQISNLLPNGIEINVDLYLSSHFGWTQYPMLDFDTWMNLTYSWTNLIWNGKCLVVPSNSVSKMHPLLNPNELLFLSACNFDFNDIPQWRTLSLSIVELRYLLIHQLIFVAVCGSNLNCKTRQPLVLHLFMM